MPSQRQKPLAVSFNGNSIILRRGFDFKIIFPYEFNRIVVYGNVDLNFFHKITAFFFIVTQQFEKVKLQAGKRRLPAAYD